MKGGHGCRRTFKTPFLIPDYFLHAVSQAHEHLWPRVTDSHLGVKTTLLILHSPETGEWAQAPSFTCQNLEPMAKATLGTRVRKGKGFKKRTSEQSSHWVQGRLANSGGAPGKPAFESAARRTGCRGGWRLRR